MAPAWWRRRGSGELVHVKHVAKPSLRQARTGVHCTGMQSGAGKSLSSVALLGAPVSLRWLSPECAHSDTALLEVPRGHSVAHADGREGGGTHNL